MTQSPAWSEVIRAVSSGENDRARQDLEAVSELTDETRQVAGQLLDGMNVAHQGLRDQIWSLRVQLGDAAEELRGTRGELIAVRSRLATAQRKLELVEGELLTTRNKLLESWDHVREMRRSVSWRTTAPLRAVRRAQLR